MNTSILEIDLIKKVLMKKGYSFFEKGQYNLNIIGIRSNKKEAGFFDDFITCIYKDSNNKWVCRYWKATTDAGTYWLSNPMNQRGTALLVPNQYRGVYKIGMFKGRYKCLVQSKPLKVYRDNNKNKIQDYDPKTIQEGMFAIQIHKSNPYFISVVNDKWSAGCQVFSAPKDFSEFMDLVYKAESVWGDSFTYTLIEEKDFENV
jgi:hypothetical protein